MTHKPLWRTILLASALALVAGCGDSGGGGNPGDDGGGTPDSGGDVVDDSGSDTDMPDTGTDPEPDTDQDTGDDDTGSDTDGGDDVDDGGADADEPEPLIPIGEQCEGNRECETGLCMQIEAGTEQGFCSSFCFEDSDCPDDGWDCIFFRNSGGDVSLVCVPNELCIDDDEDGFGVGPGCDGPDCDDDDDEVNPGADEVCDGADNDCDGNIDDFPVDVNNECETGFPGLCSEGRTTCQFGSLGCSGRAAPADEICDALDNDCDGNVDEDADGNPLEFTCYSGAAETIGVGQCVAGVRDCVEGSVGACEGQILPTIEICNGLDDDCDGETDEGSPGAGQVCMIDGALGVCSRGLTQCNEDGAVVCVQQTTMSDEICDGLDNNCNGQVDESGEVDDEDNPIPISRACYEGPDGTVGVGVCAEGVQVCEGGEFSLCRDDVTPIIELCNNADDNCNGMVDEGNPASGFSCDTGLLGICSTGQTDCSGGSRECVPDFVATDEICNGFDDDCDGIVDESVVAPGEPMTRSCYSGPDGTAGLGLCVTGLETCVVGDWSSCVGETVPSGEFCDGEDNDCDGATDEEDDGTPIEEVCYSGTMDTLDVGLCNGGTRQCNSGIFGACQGETLPLPVELCNGEDDDCDGMPDEGAPGSGVRCSTGGQGVCAEGLTVCTAGGIDCDPVFSEGPELCDNLDNDCDGDTDEQEDGSPLDETCYTGPDDTEGVGECVSGTRICTTGRFGTCSAEVTPTTEVCDGLDNDCDGETDEGGPGAGARCSTGDLGVCSTGTTICNGDGDIECVPDAVSTTETCDGLDNDCDGDVDEEEDGSPLSLVCYDGPDGTAGQGLCTAGSQTCVDGEFSDCQGQVTPTFEVCDGDDNDCDGTPDDGNPGGGFVCDTGDDGVCANGTTVCDAGSIVCEADFTSGTEVCDGVDNDCDGGVDENGAGTGPLERTCYSGAAGTETEGLCSSGTQTCSGGAFGVCAGEVIPNLEVCDGEDNDCDGSEDENNPEGGFACSTGDDGICATGTTTCATTGVECVPNATATTEICDGFDNDCDGATDENAAGSGPLTRSCYEGPTGTAGEGLCTAGVQTCGGGVFSSCVGMVLPQAETCDGEDNDCDGTPDQGNPGGGGTCTVAGQQGVCAIGFNTCQGGSVQCVSPNTATAEICDGFDNDCDGATDENAAGSGPLTQSCYSGDPGDIGTGECRAGTQTCGSGAFGACIGQQTPVTEVCDGLDNDCDGDPDEGVPLEMFYLDTDQDNFGDDATGLVEGCFNPDLHTFNPGDCYDLNADANPLQTGYFGEHRGDNSYDYNCDGDQERRYDGFIQCFEDPPLCRQLNSGWTPDLPLSGGTACSSDDDCADGEGCAFAPGDRLDNVGVSVFGECQTIPDCGGTAAFIEDCTGNGSNCEFAECIPGETGCECDGDGLCDDVNAQCTPTTSVCVRTDCEDALGCECGTDGVCDAGLVCNDGACTAPDGSIETARGQQCR